MNGVNSSSEIIPFPAFVWHSSFRWSAKPSWSPVITTTNVAISPQFLTKMANDSDLEDEYIKEIGNMKKLDEQFAKQQADIGWRVEQGWAIDKDGNISSWAIGHKDSKVKSFLQNMSEKAEEILQKQLEKAKDTKEEKEVFSMKKHKEVIKKNKVDLKV